MANSFALRQEYLRLYREYAKEIRAFEIATQKRRAIRQRLKEQVDSPFPRRPVGAKPKSKAPLPKSEQPSGPAQVYKKEIWMGKTLGWTTLVGTMPRPTATDTTGEVDIDHMHDAISLALYRNAKERYRRAKQAFFQFVRRNQWQEARRRARENTKHAAQLQLLGIEHDEESLKIIQEDLQAACHAAWKLYEAAPNPKTAEAKFLLVNTLAEAQLVGVEEVDPAIMERMEKELLTLLEAGDLQTE